MAGRVLWCHPVRWKAALRWIPGQGSLPRGFFPRGKQWIFPSLSLSLPLSLTLQNKTQQKLSWPVLLGLGLGMCRKQPVTTSLTIDASLPSLPGVRPPLAGLGPLLPREKPSSVVPLSGTHPAGPPTPHSALFMLHGTNLLWPVGGQSCPGCLSSLLDGGSARPLSAAPVFLALWTVETGSPPGQVPV